MRSHEIDGMTGANAGPSSSETVNRAQPSRCIFEGDCLMKPDGYSAAYLRYGRILVKSGVSGLRSGQASHLQGQPLSQALTQSARASLSLATLGACAGLLRVCVSDRRRRLPRTIKWSV